MVRWMIAAALASVNAGASAGQEAKHAEASLRPTYYACLKASGGVTVNLNNCIGTEFDFQDKRLNTAYKALRQSLPAAEQIALRDQERAWMAERDRECAPRANGGTADMLGSNECRLDYTALRADELERRQQHL